jgi:thymidylate kinase
MNNISGIIVLDGADASGKSTLAKHFVEKYGARYLHCGLYRDVFARHLAAFRLAERWASRGELVIIDRLWLSELSYGDTLRGGAKHPVSARCFDRLLLRAAAVQVICVQKDQQAHLARFIELKKKRDEKFNEEQVSKVIKYYLWLTGEDYKEGAFPSSTKYAVTFRDSLEDRMDVFVLEFEDACRDLEGYATTIINTLHALRLQQNPAGLSRETPNLTGNTNSAKYLLVGERLSHPRFRYPFISRDDQLSSALWLNRALDNLGIPENQLVMTNALEWGSGKDTSPELQVLVDETRHKWEKIVALGRVAATHLSNLGLKEDWDFAVVPHPQWARRFKYRDHSWYCQVLGEALGLGIKEA